MILVNPEMVQKNLIEYDGYYTVAGDTFKSVCRNIGLDRAQWRAYYKWVNSEFMRGATFIQRNSDDTYLYPGGIGFLDPFQKGVKQSPLPIDTKFPLPKGPAWDKVIDANRVKSNDVNEEHVQARYERRALLTGIISALGETARMQANESELETYEGGGAAKVAWRTGCCRRDTHTSDAGR